MIFPRIVKAITALGVLLVLVLAGCGGDDDDSASGGGSEGGLTKVDFRLSWVAGGDAAPWVVADAKGFYKEEGLDVKILQASDATSTIKLVATGEDPIGYVYGPPDVLLAGSKGVDLTSFYAFYQTAPFGILSKASTGITQPADLRDKKVGITQIPIDQASFDTMIESAGLTRDDMEVVDAGFTGLISMESGKLDANSDLELNGRYLQESTGTQVNFLNYSDYGVPDYEYESLVANPDYLQEHPDVIRAFATGTSRGIQYALDHPEEAIDLVLEAYPNNSRKEALFTFEQGWGQLHRSDQTEEHGLGYQDPQEWQTMASYLLQAGLIDEPINPTEFYTNDFINPDLK